MRELCNRIVGAPLFQRAVIAVILLSGLLAGVETNPDLVLSFGPWMKAADGLVMSVFLVELVLRLGAHGRSPMAFFRDPWNVFDFMVVILCLLPAGGPFATVLRLARVLRLLRLATSLPRLQLLVGALLRSLGAMGYVALLLLLITYIYAVMGVHLFRTADPQHFGSLGPAFQSLLRVITLDNWSELLQSAQKTAPVQAAIYFVSFILFGTMIMLNLFIGIITNSMSTLHAEMENTKPRTDPVGLAPCEVAKELEALEAQFDEIRLRMSALSRRIQAKPPGGD